jgi:hypothetical protein
MASTSTPRILIFKADGSITSGKAVKAGHADGFVAIGAATTDKCIGIAQNTASASGKFIEVAINGGGAKALLGGSVASGHDVVCTTDGTLIVPGASADEIIGRAVEGGVSGDIVDIEVYYGKALASG